MENHNINEGRASSGSMAGGKGIKWLDPCLLFPAPLQHFYALCLPQSCLYPWVPVPPTLAPAHACLLCCHLPSSCISSFGREHGASSPSLAMQLLLQPSVAGLGGWGCSWGSNSDPGLRIKAAAAPGCPLPMLNGGKKNPYLKFE